MEEEHVLRDVRRASRVIGLGHGAATFAVTAFIGSITSHVAVDLAVHNQAVTAANTAGGVFGSLFALLIIVRRRGVPRKWVTVSLFQFAAVGLIVIAGAGLRSTVPGIWLVYGGLCVVSLALVALTPIRPAVAAQFRDHKLDGTFTSRSRAWSYGSIGVLVLLVGAITASPLEWRVATLVLAAWMSVCGLMLALFKQFPKETPSSERIGAWELWDVMRAGQQRRLVIAVGAAAFTAQLVYVSLEPFLSAPALLGAAASAWVGVGLGVVKLGIVPVIRRQGALSDDRVRRSARRAARALAASAAVAAVTIPHFPLQIVLPALLLAVVLVELGNGPMADAARTYGSRLGIEADAMSTVAQQLSYDIAGVIATFAQIRLLGLFTFITPWQRVVIAWLIAAVIVVALTWRSEWRDHPRARLRTNRGPAELQIGVGLYRNTLARFRLVVTLRDRSMTVRAPDGSRFEVHTVIEGGERDPRIPTCIVWFGVTRPRPRRQRRRAGKLFPGARFPIVADGRRIGHGRWLGRPGSWELRDGTTICRSDELEHEVISRLRMPTA